MREADDDTPKRLLSHSRLGGCGHRARFFSITFCALGAWGEETGGDERGEAKRWYDRGH